MDTKPCVYFNEKKWTLFGLCVFYVAQMAILFFVAVVSYINFRNRDSDLGAFSIIALIVLVFLSMSNVVGIVAALRENVLLTLIFIVLNGINNVFGFVLSYGLPNFWGTTLLSMVSTIVAIVWYFDLKKMAQTSEDKLEGEEVESNNFI